MDLPVREWFVTDCKVEGCERPHSHFGFCDLHAKRYKKGTDLHAPVRKPSGLTECTLPNCDNPHDSKGLCGNHGYTERRYNLSREQTLKLHLGTCDICGRRDEGRELAVDHNHNCCPGKGSCGDCVRGFLCSGCNIGLGMFKDDVNSLRKAIEYLEDVSISKVWYTGF